MPVFLPREFHGQRSLAGYSPWGHKESDTTEQLTITAESCFPTEEGVGLENPDVLSVWSPALLPLTRRILLAMFILEIPQCPYSSLSTLQVLLLGVPRLLLHYDSLSGLWLSHSSSQQHSPFFHLTASKKQSRCSLALMSAIEAASRQSFACFLGFSCQDRCLMHLSKFKRKNYVSPPGLR